MNSLVQAKPSDFRVKVYRHEVEMVELRRKVELGSAPSPILNQPAGNDRFPILIYSGKCSTLHGFLKLSTHELYRPNPNGHQTTAAALQYTGNNSRRELNR